VPGPVPKPAAQRRRRNTSDRPVATATAKPAALSMNPDSGWHPLAQDWFRSLGESGQSVFYQASDWATARYVAEAMSRSLSSGERFSANLFAAITSAMTELLTTEGARRRLRVELERGEEPPAPPSVALMAKYRKAAGK
jgi:hypothetical protein